MIVVLVAEQDGSVAANNAETDAKLNDSAAPPPRSVATRSSRTADERHTTVVTVVTVKEMANATDVAALRDGIQGSVAAALGMPLGSVRVGAPERWRCRPTL